MQGDSWLGVALSALMNIPKERIVWLGAEALRRLAGAPLSEQQRFLLSECVQAYLELDENQQQELEQLLQTETYAEAQGMNQTIYEKGIEKGCQEAQAMNQTVYEKGRRQGQMELLLALLEEHFGCVSQATRDHLDQLTLDELRRLALKVSAASSLVELGLPG